MMKGPATSTVKDADGDYGPASLVLRRRPRHRRKPRAAALMSSVANTDTLPVPTDNPILNVSGEIATTNKDGAAVFDRAMLETLGMVSFETTTPWFTGKEKFEGVPMAKLMKTLGASGDTLVVTALNDYTSELPLAILRHTMSSLP
jgi:hypothetical protein